MDYRRNFQPGGTYFFTVVTHGRMPIFAERVAVDLLREIVRGVKIQQPFEMIAWVILPDHLHMIWKLPPNDAAYSTRWSKIKSLFTRQWLVSGGMEDKRSYGQKNDRRRAVWQNRFMEHTICDENDLTNHIDYIHFNPVKHACCERPLDWEWSSLHAYVQRGVYPVHWCDTISCQQKIVGRTHGIGLE